MFLRCQSLSLQKKEQQQKDKNKNKIRVLKNMSNTSSLLLVYKVNYFKFDANFIFADYFKFG